MSHFGGGRGEAGCCQVTDSRALVPCTRSDPLCRATGDVAALSTVDIKLLPSATVLYRHQ